jgi:predicted nucleic acid-binding protein
MRSGAIMALAVDCIRRLDPRQCRSQGGQDSRTRAAASAGNRCAGAFHRSRREVTDVLSRPKFARAVSLARRERFLEELRRSAIWFEPSIAVSDCRDAKDDKYLELALAAGANMIVSSDGDLLVLHPWRGIPILSPAAFLARTDEVIE